MIGTPPEIKLADDTADSVNKVVLLIWEDGECEFETRKELTEYINKLKIASKNAFKPLIQ